MGSLPSRASSLESRKSAQLSVSSQVTLQTVRVLSLILRHSLKRLKISRTHCHSPTTSERTCSSTESTSTTTSTVPLPLTTRRTTTPWELTSVMPSRMSSKETPTTASTHTPSSTAQETSQPSPPQ